MTTSSPVHTTVIEEPVDQRLKENVDMQSPAQTLDILQEYFWACEPSYTRQALLVAELDGTQEQKAWKAAAVSLLEQYPMLGSRMEKRPGDRPFFRGNPQASIPLTYGRLHPLPATPDVIEHLLKESFGLGEQSLVRLSVIEGEGRTLVSLAIHHALADGLSTVKFLAEWIDAACGTPRNQKAPIPPPLFELLKLPPPQPYNRLSQDPSTCDAPQPAPAPAKVTLAVLPREEVIALRKRARAEGASVHAAMVAALSRVAESLKAPSVTNPQTILTPIDVRTILGLDSPAGFYISAHVDLAAPPFPSFWAHARQLRKGWAPSLTIEGVRSALLALRAALPGEANPARPSTLDPNHALDFTMMVSNYGETDLGVTPGLRIRAIYPACIAGQASTQTVMIATFNGRMHLTHLSRHPVPGLLEQTRALLREASLQFASYASKTRNSKLRSSKR